jgi:hypothetical protein
MTPNPYDQHWQQAENEVLFVMLAYLIGGCCFIGTLLSGIRSWPLAVALLVAAVMVFIALAVWHGQRKGLVTKVFYVKLQAAAQVVDNVLRQKGMPFDRVNQLTTFRPIVVFNLPDDQLAIHVREYRNKYVKGVRVEIGAVTDENRTLVRSLQDKIDDAFTPKGL